MSPSAAGVGAGARYIDPDHVYDLYINRRADDLVGYISSFPGAGGGDARFDVLKLTVSALRVPGHKPMELPQLQVWANHARELAKICRFSTSKNIADLTNTASNPGHCSEMKSTNHVSGSHVLRHSPMLDQGSSMLNQGPASNLRISHSTSSSTPLQSILVDHYMDPFDSSAYPGSMPRGAYVGRIPGSYMTPSDPSSYSGRMFHVPGTVVNGALALPAMLNQPSASNSGAPSAAPFPYRASPDDVSNHHPRYAMPNQASASNTRFPDPMFQQENFNHADSKGMEHSPCVALQLQEDRSVRLSVASFVPEGSSEGFGGVLVQGTRGRFIGALCFPVPGTEPASVFLAACSESISAVELLAPTAAAVVLESHLFPLLSGVFMEQELRRLQARLDQIPGCELSTLDSEESNAPACLLAMRAAQIGSYHVFLQKPDWLCCTN